MGLVSSSDKKVHMFICPDALGSDQSMVPVATIKVTFLAKVNLFECELCRIAQCSYIIT